MDTGTIAVMTRDGDTPITWRRADPVEVEDARQRFEFYRDKGYQAFRQAPGGGRGERLDAFDPGVEHAVMVPPMVGG